MRYCAGVIMAVILNFFSTAKAFACAVCFGAADSSVKIALALAIITLLMMLLGVLSGIVAFFMNMQKRTRKMTLGHS